MLSNSPLDALFLIPFIPFIQADILLYLFNFGLNRDGGYELFIYLKKTHSIAI